MTQKRVFVDGDHGSILRSPPVTQANILSPTKHSIPTKANDLDPTAGRKKLHNIDLNNVYVDSEECMENLESCDAPVNVLLVEAQVTSELEEQWASGMVQGWENDTHENGHVPGQHTAIDLDYYSTNEVLIEVGPERLKEEDCFYDLPYNSGYQIFVLRLQKTRDEIMKCTFYICRYIL